VKTKKVEVFLWLILLELYTDPIPIWSNTYLHSF